MSDMSWFQSSSRAGRTLFSCAVGLAAAGAVLTAGSAIRAFAGAEERPAGAAECRWADTPIELDGQLSDRAWKGAQALKGFALPWLGDAARPARQKAETRLLWDRDYLYFSGGISDTDLKAAQRPHDGTLWEDDVLELFLKPSASHPGYYEFQANAGGATLDIFFPKKEEGQYERYRSAGEFRYEARVVAKGTLNNGQDRDRGWTVEGRIPWTDFLRSGGRPAVGEEWRFAFCRFDHASDGSPAEGSTTAPLKSALDFHNTAEYAPLRFVGPRVDNSLGIRLPLTTSKVLGTPEPPPPFRAARVYPNLKMAYPLIGTAQPLGGKIVAVSHQIAGGPSGLVRFDDAAGASDFETLLVQNRLMYDVTFHPEFARNGYVYVSSKGPMDVPTGDRKMRVARYTMQTQPPYRLDPASELTIVDWPSDGHDGGAIAFGRDGMLYITTGDGTSDSDINLMGQRMDVLLAKLLRLDVDHPSPGKAYSVPSDNPFVGRPGIRPETWAFGFRNPWRIAADRETGQIWVGNNGQDAWETAYLIEKAANYGWSTYEGSHPFYTTRPLGPSPHTKPTVEHPHSEFRSLTGGIVYRGSRYPDWRGAYIYGDYSTGKIWGIKHEAGKVVWQKELADTTLQITGFGMDSKGELLICDLAGGGKGGFYTLDPTPTDKPRPVFPRKLSASGLFRSVKGHQVQPALIPYDVNSPLWSDGAHKERFIALPPGNASIEVTPTRGWNFPDDTVLVKSFALDGTTGRRWIETRFLVKQEGEWVGYSYAWNDAQTEATLVEPAGADKAFEIPVDRTPEHPDGFRKQVWRYPSRAECMTCHSRAQNFVLGLNTLQFNRDNSYHGKKVNQMALLEQLGVIKTSGWEADAVETIRTAGRARGLSGGDLDRYVSGQRRRDGQRTAPASSLLNKPPAELPRLFDPYGEAGTVADRARSYLHSNCSSCHIEAGGGNSAIQLEYTTALKAMLAVDVKPLHDVFGKQDARILAPGSPARSVLLHRISIRERGQMPPLATSTTDPRAMQLLSEWIRSLK